jgi:hypothetical protein
MHPPPLDQQRMGGDPHRLAVAAVVDLVAELLARG